MDKQKILELKKKAVEARRKCIEMVRTAGSGHIGGSFSAIEMMIYLYFYKMRINPQKPHDEKRDIFILSKGHASSGYYSVLSMRGYFPDEELATYRQINSRLQGHPHLGDLPGVECSSGSLGQGLSFGIGMALGYKKKGLDNNVYVMIGDGEAEEGQIWEALMLQSFLKLDNLIIMVDCNRLQLDDFVDNVTGLYDLGKKLNSFGYNVIEIDGNDFEEIDKAFSNLDRVIPNIIIANTIKGKGISFMENSIEWHSKKVSDEEYKIAMKELDGQEAALNG